VPLFAIRGVLSALTVVALIAFLVQPTFDELRGHSPTAR